MNYQASFIFLCCVVSVLALASPSDVSEDTPREVTVATALWPPTFTNTESSGLYERIVQRVFQDHKVNFYYTSYERSKLMVANKQVDLWLGSYINEEDFAWYPTQAFDADQVVIVYRHDFPITDNLVKTMQAGRPAWIAGYGYDVYFPSLFSTPYLVHSTESGIRLVTAGRVDFLVDDLSSVIDALQNVPDDADKVTMQVFGYLPLYPAFAQTPEGKILLSLWDKRLAELIAEGRIQAIYQDYGVEYILDRPSNLSSIKSGREQSRSSQR